MSQLSGRVLGSFPIIYCVSLQAQIPQQAWWKHPHNFAPICYTDKPVFVCTNPTLTSQWSPLALESESDYLLHVNVKTGTCLEKSTLKEPLAVSQLAAYVNQEDVTRSFLSRTVC